MCDGIRGRHAIGYLVEGDRNVGISGSLDNIRKLDNLLSSDIQVIVGVNLKTDRQSTSWLPQPWYLANEQQEESSNQDPWQQQ